MTKPMRKSPQELQIKQRPSERTAANDNENEGEFEATLERELKSDRYLEVHQWDIKAMRAFRNAFSSIKHADPTALNFYVIHPERNVAITRAFGLKDSKNITFLTDTWGDAEMMKKRGYETIKGNAEKKVLSEKADVVIVLDENVRPSSKLLRNVAPGGWILWPTATANALRGLGKYTCMGVIENDGLSPSVQTVDDEFWTKKEVETDDDLKNAPEDEGVVTYEEAKHAVQEAFGKEHNIVENYRRLVEMAKEQNKSAIANGKTEVTCTVERGGKTFTVTVKIALPLKKRTFNEKDLVIFKKHENV